MKKIRVQLFTKEGTPIVDRLVDQNTEFYQGPKESHDGPIRIEFTLEDRADVDKCIDYLSKLTGKLPIETKVTTGRGRPRTVTTDFVPDNSREVMLEEALASSKDQDIFIKKMRNEHDFVFLDKDFLTSIIPEAYKIKDRHLDKYQWLVRLTRKAKDPRNDKYDLALLIGITILPDNSRNDKMAIYFNGTLDRIEKLPIPEKPITFKQTNLIKYPHYMIQEEREKWGFEHRVLLNDPTKKPTKFYLRWAKDVVVGDELKLKKQ